MNPLALAVPIYLLLMLFEYIVSTRAGKNFYTWKGTFGNILCGIGHVFVESLTKIPVIFLYALASRGAVPLEHHGWSKWLLLFVIIDFVFYVSHFMSHKVRWMWAIHGVHHQSEDYNFSVGLRQAWLHKLTAFWTPLPLALLGFSLEDYILALVVHSSLQIWTHTQLLPKRIPVLEWILVTPSHHRVHHGKNARYIDKNFAGILSLWDYLFGTYEPETEPVRYGVSGLKERVNPFSSNFIMFAPSLWKPLPKAPRTTDKPDWPRPFLMIILCLGYFLIEYKLALSIKIVVVLSLLGLIARLGWREDHPRGLTRKELR
ncbi:MAG: sterol desaturase family protein [Bacteriovoracia bacterium]